MHLNFVLIFKNFQFQIIEIDIAEAEKLDKILQPVHSAMFIESNPSPVKYAAKLMNLCDDAVRLPLVKTSENANLLLKKL